MKALVDKSAAFIVAALWRTGTAVALLSKRGNVTLFSDAGCAGPVYDNRFMMSAAGRTRLHHIEDDTMNRLVLRDRVIICIQFAEDGSKPYFGVYGDVTCSDLVESYEPGEGYEDGTCVTPGEYKSMKFICDGSSGTVDDGGDEPASAGVATSATSVTTTAEASSMQPTTNLILSSTTMNSITDSTPTTSSSSSTPADISATAIATGEAPISKKALFVLPLVVWLAALVALL
ncbi:hypothetical protein F5B20DRAFT_587078 [Whalleya microplaca]|nr:hypothetical protein F5B20DRAFT_587078 [Whalleya microplaca]